ncbi:hypothetical protein DPMN_161810 [Dreissena polymorpha]|uniref:Uncharacterized protein n=1 Tax=Dreissena polymorpha TaxID=45954 RepID=A0A9D4IRF6_DREPO|nr:hypothetical protein DPMN_161810 [Dreissena polymorpha]
MNAGRSEGLPTVWATGPSPKIYSLRRQSASICFLAIEYIHVGARNSKALTDPRLRPSSSFMAAFALVLLSTSS